MAITTEVTVRHAENSKGVQAFAEKKASRLAQTFPKAESVKIVVDKQKSLWTAEVIVAIKGQTAIGAKQGADNAISAIDTAAAKAERQLRKERARVISLHTRTTDKK